METSKIIELLSYTLPSVITGGVAYLLFTSYFKDQQHTRRWLNQKETQKQALPLRLQAYERLSLLLERINPTKLLIRVTPFFIIRSESISIVARLCKTTFVSMKTLKTRPKAIKPILLHILAYPAIDNEI
jgi:hypothetical protein